VSAQIAGRSFCALGDAAATPFPGAMKYFADEIALGAQTAASDLYDPVATTVLAGVNA
jgi:NADH-quinone oxidoreductase subunit F